MTVTTVKSNFVRSIGYTDLDRMARLVIEIDKMSAMLAERYATTTIK